MSGNRKPDSYFAKKFRAQVEKRGGCWKWLGTLKPKGYGLFDGRRDGKRYWSAHRYAYHLLKGPIPKGLHVLHRCDNPSCTNPDHLWLGTNADNHLDKLRKGRQSKGRRVNTAKLREHEVLEIFNSSDSVAALSKRFNIHNSVVYNIRNGKCWSHVTGKVYQKKVVSLISEIDRIKALRLRDDGMSIGKIADEIGFSYGTAYRILTTHSDASRQTE